MLAGVLLALTLLPLGRGQQALAANADSTELQQLVDDAPDGGTVTITRDYTLDATLTIPAGKSVTITDDGSAHTISGTSEPVISVAGELTLSATADENLTISDIATGESTKGTAVAVTGTFNFQGGTLRGTTASGLQS